MVKWWNCGANTLWFQVLVVCFKKGRGDEVLSRVVRCNDKW